MSRHKAKLPLPSYIVIKKMKEYGKLFFPPRIVARGKLEFVTIRLPADKAAIWNHCGCVCDYEKFRKGMLVHPDSIKA